MQIAAELCHCHRLAMRVVFQVCYRNVNNENWVTLVISHLHS